LIDLDLPDLVFTFRSFSFQSLLQDHELGQAIAFTQHLFFDVVPSLPLLFQVPLHLLLVEKSLSVKFDPLLDSIDINTVLTGGRVFLLSLEFVFEGSPLDLFKFVNFGLDLLLCLLEVRF